ncbi:MAG: hypothetical protein K2P86_08885 [Xanthobacteraceae bacterium]|jgi:hypothetical protein|nr:hypothetical protein [Xanthobacteraceae bacterium]
MSRDKVHILQIPKRPAARGSFAARIPMDLLFLAGLGVAFVLAHYSDKPPLVEKPISLERIDGPLVAENNRLGVRVLETGLRGLER